MANLSESEVVRFWQHQLLKKTELITETGESVKIIYPGRANDDRGADFRDAVIAVDNRLTRGDIEIHVRSSDWLAHRHHRDAVYDRVILHVVMWHDGEQVTPLHNGKSIPVLALYRYLHISDEPQPAFTTALTTPCPGRTGYRTTGCLLAALDRAGEQRFLIKAAGFHADLAEMGAAQSLYRGVMGALGYSKNKQPFLALADRLPYQILESLAHRVASDEECLACQQALLLGTAGLLPSQQQNRRQFCWLADCWLEKLEEIWVSRHHSAAMSPGDWHFFKVRPNNSPVRRLLAISYLLLRYRRNGLFTELVDMIKNVSPDHCCHGLEQELVVIAVGYRQGYPGSCLRGSPGSITLLGSRRAADIIVNVILPFTFAWGQSNSQPELAEKSLALYQRYSRLAVNSIERHMKDQLGLSSKLVNSARRQQGLIHIYHTLCTQGRCNHCPLCQPQARHHVYV